MVKLKRLKKGRISFLISLVFPGLLCCQSLNVDSLESVLQASIDDTLRMSILTDLYDYYADKDLDKSLIVVNRLLTIAGQGEEKKYLCNAYRYLGDVQRSMNLTLDTVLSNYERALTCCEERNDPKCRGKVFNSIGGVYYRSGLHVEAVSNYQQALEIAEEIGDTVSRIACLANIGSIQKRRLNYEQALSYAEKALSLAREIQHESYIGMITNNLASIYFNQQEYDQALELYKEAVAIKRKQGAQLSMAVTLANIGGIQVELGRYELAQNYLQEAYAIARKNNYHFGLALTLRFMASSSYHRGRYREAIQYSNEGLQSLAQRKSVQYARDFHTVLSESFEKLSQLDSALTHLRIAQQINDSLFQSEKELQFQELEISYQVKQKEVENELLKTEQSYTQQKLTIRTYLSAGLIVALFLACGWGVALYRNNRAKKKMNSQLESQVAERTRAIQIANDKLKQANYELKSFNHIASHDLKEPIRNVGNYVGLISRKLPTEIKIDLQDYFDIIHRSTSQLYTLIEDIASYTQVSGEDIVNIAAVDLDTLLANVELGLQSVLAVKNGRIISKDLPIIHSSPSLIFIVLKNLIENGLKFNQASTPTVEVRYRSLPNEHQLIISDNGIGIDPGFHEHIFVMFKRLHSMARYQGSGIGLALVKLAVEKLRGDIEVNSQVGEGASFVIRLPRNSNAEKT